MDKLRSGDQFPSLKLKMLDGSTWMLPDDFRAEYNIVLIYRGHWWPFCGRHLAGFEERRAALEEQGAAIIAGSVDGEEDTRKLAADKGLNFNIAIHMNREHSDRLGAWWEEEKEYMQPSEFIVDKEGKVVYSAYADGPLGRMGPQETLDLLKHLNQEKD